MDTNKKEFKRICPKCGKEFIVVGTQHEFDRDKLRRFCCRACANSRNHNEETRVKTSTKLKDYYKTHDNSTMIKTYYCKQCGAPFTMKDRRDTGGRSYCSSECRELWLKTNLYSKLGGYREGSGRSNSGWYKGIYCSSTWELAFLIYHLDHNLPIRRCQFHREYEFEGKKYKYYPDFITDKGVIEIKGFNTPQWDAKHKANPDIIVLFKDDMVPYMDYVKSRYTNILEELYDNSKPVDKIQNRKYYWVHKGDTQTMILRDKLDDYLSDGWIKGRKV